MEEDYYELDLHEESIYDDEEVQRELDNNQISGWEAAFQRGYNEALE